MAVLLIHSPFDPHRLPITPLGVGVEVGFDVEVGVAVTVGFRVETHLADVPVPLQA